MSEEPKISQVPEPGEEMPPEESPLGEKPGEDASLAPLSTNAHRVTGDLEPPRAKPNQPGASDSLQPKSPVSDDLLPGQPPAPVAPRPGQPRKTESLMRRLTGSIGRSTGPLGRTGPLAGSSADLPAKDVDEAFGAKLTADVPPSTEGAAAPLRPAKPSSGPASPEPQGIVRRITSSLRRITGPLRDTAPLRSSSRGQDAALEEKPSSVEVGREGPPKSGSGELVEKRKRSTGPLGSMLSGILRGTPAEGETAQQQPKPDDYVSEIRQNLANEEVVEAKKPKGSGFLQMITGGFRRMTGSLGRTSEISPPRVSTTEPVQPELATSLDLEPPGSEIEAEIEEVLLEDRLAGTAVSESVTWAEPEDIVIELGTPEPGGFDLEEPALAESPPEPGSLGGDEPISLLESGAIAALDQAEKEKQQEEAPSGWMAEMRQEAVEAEKGAEETGEKPRGITSPLRDFIAGILRPEEKQLPSADAEVPDELVTGRLGLDQAPRAAEEEAAFTMPAVEEGTVETILPGTAEQEAAEVPAGEETPQVEDTSFLERLQAQGTGTLELPKAPEDSGAVFTISPEDEQLLWGPPPEEPRTIRAEEYWDPLQISLQAPEVTPESTAEPGTYAPAFLPDAQTAPFQGETRPLKRRTTGRLKREAERKPFEDIRSVLMEDYRAAEQQRLGKAAAPGAAAGGFLGSAASSADAAEAFEPGPFETEALAAPRAKGLGEWLGTRTTLQKIILVELALVVLALLTAVPFFTYMLLRGPKIAVTPQTQLPADIPYPTGVTLPGGWQFQLGRNTMVNGVWKPTQSEWLEGTELRRVVALPWNRQTEAVVRSFQEGDQIELELSNSDILKYTVERIGQVSISDSSVYSDTTPSLIIILFDKEESAQERWVVFCKR